MNIDYKLLMDTAKEASKMSYSPFSRFAVGAGVLASSGKVYSGCNVENSSFGMTICAERNATGSAVLYGERKFKAIAIYSPKQDNCTPCGACRQVLHEFCEKDEELDIIVKVGNDLKVYTLAQLLPESFTL